MKKVFNLLVWISILNFSCENPNTEIQDTEDQIISKSRADISKLNDELKKYEEPSQKFKVLSNKPSIVTGRKGTKISINPNDLITESGKSLGQNIEVELKELTNQTELLRANAQTVSDGKLLISGGAYYIGMTSNGEKLKLKEDKTIKVQFPKKSDKEMKLFYGERNELGQMNWRNENIIFKPNKQSEPEVFKDTITKPKNKKSDIDAILDYVDSGYNPTPEEKEKNIKQRNNYIKEGKDIVKTLQVYDAIGINELGWINCDRFLNLSNTTELYVSFNPKDSIQNANVYIVFGDINSVMQAYYFSEDEPQFENIPVGYKIRLIAYTVKEENVFAYSTDMTITEGQKLVLNLKKINDKDFKKLISK